MSRRVKDKVIGARIDESFDVRLTAYAGAAELTVGELIRVALEEYMTNHPVKQPQPSTLELAKPGGGVANG